MASGDAFIFGTYRGIKWYNRDCSGDLVHFVRFERVCFSNWRDRRYHHRYILAPFFLSFLGKGIFTPIDIGFLTKIRESTRQNTPEALACMNMLKDLESRLTKVQIDEDFSHFLYYYTNEVLYRLVAEDVRLQSLYYQKRAYGFGWERDPKKLIDSSKTAKELYMTGSVRPINLQHFPRLTQTTQNLISRGLTEFEMNDSDVGEDAIRESTPSAGSDHQLPDTP